MMFSTLLTQAGNILVVGKKAAPMSPDAHPHVPCGPNTSKKCGAGASGPWNERYLQLQSDPILFGELKSAGAQGVLLPGVDGSVAGLYFFNTAISTAVRSELDGVAQAMGGRCVVTTGEDFGAQLRA